MVKRKKYCQQRLLLSIQTTVMTKEAKSLERKKLVVLKSSFSFKSLTFVISTVYIHTCMVFNWLDGLAVVSGKYTQEVQDCNSEQDLGVYFVDKTLASVKSLVVCNPQL